MPISSSFEQVAADRWDWLQRSTRHIQITAIVIVAGSILSFVGQVWQQRASVAVINSRLDAIDRRLRQTEVKAKDSLRDRADIRHDVEDMRKAVNRDGR